MPLLMTVKRILLTLSTTLADSRWEGGGTWLTLCWLPVTGTQGRNLSWWRNYLWFSLGDAESLPGQLFLEQSRIDKWNRLQWKSATRLHACSDARCQRVCVRVVNNVRLTVVDGHVLTAVKQEATATPADAWSGVGATSHLCAQKRTHLTVKQTQPCCLTELEFNVTFTRHTK